jgi:two-component system LytT family response regulator
MGKRLSVLVVDDEELARIRLRDLISELDQVDVVGEAENGIDAVEQIRSLKPDVVLLDVQMPGMNGFEVLAALDDVPLVIFATAYDDYAIKAFEVDSIDYLLKPIEKERLSEAMSRARRLASGGTELEREVEKLAALVRGRGVERLPVQRGKRIVLLDISKIVWIGAEEGLVFVHTRDGKFIINMTMAELDERLDDSVFFRIHRSTMVNLGHIREIVPWFSGKYRVVVDDADHTELTLSRGRAKVLREIFPW